MITERAVQEFEILERELNEIETRLRELQSAHIELNFPYFFGLVKEQRKNILNRQLELISLVEARLDGKVESICDAYASRKRFCAKSPTIEAKILRLAPN